MSKVAHGHYGLEFAMTHSADEVEQVIEKLERKQNRKRRQELKSKSLRELNESLARSVDGSFRKHVEAELNRRFKNLYRLRMKG